MSEEFTAPAVPAASRRAPPKEALLSGRYLLREVIGTGGMATVYEALDQATNTVVALKQQRRDLPDVRFHREYHTLVSLRHPGIVEVFDYGTDPSGPYYTMERLRGGDLHSLGKVDAQRACEILRDLASVLAFLHSRRLLHRDLTVRNVQLSECGRPTLIDFGILATFGVSGDVAGTPPYMAPETVRGLPLDPRADLFALGALGYWLLTGSHAYPARTIAELNALWKRRPPPPSALVAGVTPELDALLLALLEPDADRRPASASDVIHAIAAVAGLEQPTELDLPVSCLDSGALVGRKGSTRRLQRRLEQADLGRGGAVIIEGACGMGKSRMLDNLAVQAQLLGNAVVRAGGRAMRSGPYRVVRELAQDFIARYPELALETAREHAPVLGHIIEELRARIPDLVLAPRAEDPSEQRLRFNLALEEWFAAASRKRPLLLLLDDAHWHDEVSVSALTALGVTARTLPLLIVHGLRANEDPTAAEAIEALRRTSYALTLRGLGAKSVEELVASIFGDHPSTARLARWMHRMAGGNPFHCRLLAQHLVDRGLVRYVDGAWVVEDDFESELAPRGLTAALDLRIAQLPAPARELACILSVLGRTASLETCVALATTQDAAEVFTALDTLVTEHVIIGDSDRYQLRHDGLRDALLRTLDDRTRQAMHLRAAAFLRDLPGDEPLLEIGQHLVAGERELEGARLLARAGLELFEAQSPHDAIDPLATALTIYERHRLAPRIIAELRATLIMAGAIAGRFPPVLPLIDETLDLLFHHAGLTTATRLSRFFGRRVGLVLGMLWASVRWLATPARRKGPPPPTALVLTVKALISSAGIYSSHFALHDLQRVVARAQILGAFPSQLPNAALLAVTSLARLVEGRHYVVEETGRPVPAIARRARRLISEYEQRLLVNLIAHNNMWAMVGAGDGDYRRWRDQIVAGGLSHELIATSTADAAYQYLQGKSRDAALSLRSIENLKLRFGPQGRHRAARTVHFLSAFIATRNVVGLRRVRKELKYALERGYQIQDYLELASGAYHLERDHPARAQGSFEKAARSPYLTVRQWATVGLAEACLEQGDPARAAELARQGIALSRDPGSGVRPCRWRGEQVLAHAEASTGDTEAATRRLQAVIEELVAEANPALLGLGFENAARVAQMGGDDDACHRYVAQAKRWYERTQEPALLARVTVLERKTATRGGKSRSSLADDLSAALFLELELRRCGTPDERAAAALELMLQESGAERGYLFVVRDGALTVAAPPDTSPEDRVVSVAERLLAEGHSSSTPEPVGEPSSGANLVAVPLSENPEDAAATVGVLVLVAGAEGVRRPNPRLLRLVARRLHEPIEDGEEPPTITGAGGAG